VRLSTKLAADELSMGTPGGVVHRPLERVYRPTFWPFQRFVHIRDRASDRGLAIYQPWPGAIACSPEGTMELVALRNAPRETAYGLFHLTANPARGIEREACTFEFAIEFTAAGDWRTNQLASVAYRQNLWPWRDPRLAELWAQANSLVALDGDDLQMVACKPASRGKGRIVRLHTSTRMGLPVSVKVAGSPVEEAFLCDARERDIQRLEVRDGAVQLTMPGTIASVRLLP
jgi:hypothetical protein